MRKLKAARALMFLLAAVVAVAGTNVLRAQVDEPSPVCGKGTQRLCQEVFACTATGCTPVERLYFDP